MKISMEFAHTNLAAMDLVEVDRSIEAARLIISQLRDQGHDVASTVLMDDKKVARSKAERGVKRLLDHLASRDCRPDGWYYERDLAKHLPELSAALPERQRKKLQHIACYRQETYGALPCSIDIALWHALRLGILGPDPLIEPVDVAVSVLGDGNKEHEVWARRDYLDHLDGGSVSSRVISLYYAEDSTHTFASNSLIPRLTTALKEAPLCPAF